MSLTNYHLHIDEVDREAWEAVAGALESSGVESLSARVSHRTAQPEVVVVDARFGYTGDEEGLRAVLRVATARWPDVEARIAIRTYGRQLKPGQRHAALWQPMFHGTRRRLGGYYRPSKAAGGWVKFTPDLELAWDHAESAPGKGAPRVHRVSPLGDDICAYWSGPEDQPQYHAGAAWVYLHRPMSARPTDFEEFWVPEQRTDVPLVGVRPGMIAP